MKRILTILFITALAAACNSGQTIVAPPKPVITLDSPSGVYAARMGRAFTITPSVANATGAEYLWLSDSEVLGTGPSLTYTVNEAGAFYIVFRVTTSAGSAEKQIRVDVGELAPPVISLAGPDMVVAGESYLLEPDVLNGEGAVFEWFEGEIKIHDGKDYTFSKPTVGNHTLTFKAANEDGSAEKPIAIEVVDRLPLRVLFPVANTSVFSGRGIYLKPIVENAANPQYNWNVDGRDVAMTPGYMFTSTAQGLHEVTLTVTDGTQTAFETLAVTVCGTEESGKRSGGGEKNFDTVYEYFPAPGQFIGDPLAGFDNETTPEAATDYTRRRLAEGKFVSLGGFGGYIVVGFDHSVENRGGYDFSIAGNQYTGSSEPGIVWVMQDVDGNGLPDDVWYELRGSEAGDQATISDYAVTYFRPGGPKMAVHWRDNRGGKGTIDHWAAWHAQCYYPAWMGESYTLRGTCLPSRTLQQGAGWVNGDFSWGYADNWGSDRLDSGDNAESGPCRTGFKISNAVYGDGTPADLQYIDFVKVQTGVNAKAGWTGEVSTEVSGFYDENI